MDTTNAPSRSAAAALDLAVFLCGAFVMIFEIVGSRVVSPYIGTSTYIWTSLIGIILASLSLGYWLGGRMADRRAEMSILAGIVVLAAGAVAVTVLVKDVVLSAVGSAGIALEVKALAASLLLFAPASICLGVVTPYAVKLRSTSLETTGRTVGRLYALSTIGSIVGTFAAGFFLIPFVGSTRTLYLIAIGLFAISLLLAPFALTRGSVAVFVVLVLGIAANEAGAYLLFVSNEVRDVDTEYSRVRIFRTTDPRTGKPIRALATDPYFAQSAMFYDSDELVFRYIRFYHLVRYFKPDLRHTLMIGGAGYSFPRDLLKRYPGASIDVVEIDPGMTAIAREHFRLNDDPRLKIVHEDARTFLNSSPPGTYDAIFMDAFGSLFSVPHHLTTVEAVRHLGRVLKDDGVVIFNLGSSIKGDASLFLQAELATYRAVFPGVLVFKVNSEYPDERLQNLVIAAFKSGLPAGLSSEDPEIAELLSHAYAGEIASGEPILTDDLAPVEYYNSIAQSHYLSAR